MQVKSIAIGLGVLIFGGVSFSGIAKYLQIRDANSFRSSCLKNNPYANSKDFCDFFVKEFLEGSLSKDDAKRLSEDTSLIFEYPKVMDRYLRYTMDKGMP